MITFFYSIKWGQGKTTHAVGYAKHSGAVVLTNDIDTGTADIYEAALGAGRIVTLEPGQSLKDWVDHFRGEDLVLDFGGFVESRVIEAAKLADICVVPLAYQSTADLMPAVKTVTALQEHAKDIAILINNTSPEHIQDLAWILASRFPDVTVLVVNHSRYMSRLADDGLSLFDLAELGGIERYQLRTVLPQISKLYSFLDSHRRKSNR